MSIEITLAKGKYPIQSEIYWTVSKEPKGGKAYLKIRHRTFYIMPKEKFVRRADKIVGVSKKELAVYEITTPFITSKEKRSRSWLGGGIQQDDINCYEEWEVDAIEYSQPELNNFIEEKLKLHK